MDNLDRTHPLKKPRFCRPLQHAEGFSLMELVVTLGISAILSLVIAQSLSNNQLQIEKVSDSLIAQQLAATITTAFSGKVGDQVLKVWQDGFIPVAEWPTASDLEEHSRPPFFNPATLQCPSSASLYSGTLEANTYRIPLDVLAIQTPFAVRGRSLQNRASLKVSDLYLVLMGDSGNNCPSLADCRVKGNCVFKLGLELKRLSRDGSWAPFRDLSYLLYCRTKKVAATQEVVEYCRLAQTAQMDQPFSCDAAAFMAAWESGVATADVNGDGSVDGADVEAFYQLCPTCAGDVNQDGRTDSLDMEQVNVFWGKLPQIQGSGTGAWGMRFSSIVPPASTPELIDWVALSNGGFPDPTPSPAYTVEDLDNIYAVYKLSNLHRPEGTPDAEIINGADLNRVLADWGCVKEPQVCFEDTPLYKMMERARKFSAPENELDGLDRRALGTCTGVFEGGREMADDPHCLSMNLNGKCEIPEEQLNPPAPTFTPRYCRRADGSHLNQWMVVGAADMAVMDYLLKVQGIIHRYRKTKANGDSCDVTADPP